MAAVAGCGAADCFVDLASPCVASPGSITCVLCQETLQPPHAPGGGGTAAGGRRARPGGGLPPPVPAQTCGTLRVVVECAGTCITWRQPPQVSLQLDTTFTEYSLRPACDACRHHTQTLMVGL